MPIRQDYHRALRMLLKCIGACFMVVAFLAASHTVYAKPAHKNFKTAIYIAVTTGKSLADRSRFDREFDRAYAQVPFDKVYLEVYRDRVFATDAEINAVKGYFKARGIEVVGGITLAAGGEGGQFGTFDYELPADRQEAQRAVELAAKHFDEVILDDFFFYTSKSEADIAAKGTRSWTQYRLDTMREVSENVVLKPAHRVNPKVRMIIKYPNWYEHFQGLGYDLEQQSQAFDGIYTGTETRDPVITDQLLQQYESYLIYRYYANIRKDGKNGGGWVDTFSTLYVDRYAEQLWATLFAKAPEITLFNWHPMSEADSIDGGTRPWADRTTTLDWDQIEHSYKKSSASDQGPGWGTAAGQSLEAIDSVLGHLGKPIGIASYKPYQSSGEDFLHNYLGNLGVPIELYPDYPASAQTILLTEAAAADANIIAKIQASLKEGKTVFVTSGFVAATEKSGFRDLVEVSLTGRKIAVDDYFNGYGAGNGYSLRDDATKAPPSILFSDMRFYTNDSWAIIRGVANAKAVPVLLMNRYAKGALYILNIPDNMGDLYNLPEGVMTQVKAYMQKDFPVRLDGPAHVALFAYDNKSFVVQSYRDTPVKVRVSVMGDHVVLNDVQTGKTISETMPLKNERDAFAFRNQGAKRHEFELSIEPHSFSVFQYH